MPQCSWLRQLEHAFEQGGGEVRGVMVRIQVVRVFAVVADELLNLCIPFCPNLVQVYPVKLFNQCRQLEEISLAVYQSRDLFGC